MRAADYVTQYTLDEVNIETDPDLLKKYGMDIPVITIDGVEVFRYRVTSEAFAKELLLRSEE